MSILSHPVNSPSACASPTIFVPRYRNWQEALSDAVRDAGELCRLLGLPSHLALKAAAAHDFPVLAPCGYIGRMRFGDIHDPLLRQVLPFVDEQSTPPGYGVNPLNERAATRQPGLLHKYRSR